MKEVKWVLALGPEGTYGHQIAAEYVMGNGLCSKDAWIKYCKSHSDLLKMFSQGEGDLAVVAATNIRGGRVDDVTKFMLENETSSMTVVKAIKASVRHCLAVRNEEGSLGPMEAVSHWQALRQCENFLQKRAFLRKDAVSSTAEAARQIRYDPPGTRRAAICSKFAAKIYGLDIIAENIADMGDDNVTTFHILGRPKKLDRMTNLECSTEVLFGLEHKPGALWEALGIFKQADVNIHDIQSFWWRKSGEESDQLTFQLIFPSSPADESLIGELQGLVPWLKVIGSYPTISAVL